MISVSLMAKNRFIIQTNNSNANSNSNSNSYPSIQSVRSIVL